MLVFIHGGGWSGGKRSDYLVYLLAFAKKGYVTATVSYRLLKDGTYPACAEDITDAFSWFYRNGEYYGYDPDRIAVIGGSAGGHLALLAAYGWGKHVDNNDSISVPGVLYCLPLWPHTMDVVQRVNDFSQEKMDEFFEEYLK